MGRPAEIVALVEEGPWMWDGHVDWIRRNTTGGPYGKGGWCSILAFGPGRFWWCVWTKTNKHNPFGGGLQPYTNEYMGTDQDEGAPSLEAAMEKVEACMAANGLEWA